MKPKHGLCGKCNNPAIGYGRLLLPDGRLSKSFVKVCEAHRVIVGEIKLYPPSEVLK